MSIPNEIQVIHDALESHKARDVISLDLRKISDAAEYFVIASGMSDTHVRALAGRVTDALHEVGRKPHHVEGLSDGRWVLLDFVDLVIHIFHPTLREYYQLEHLWTDAPTILASTGEASPAR